MSTGEYDGGMPRGLIFDADGVIIRMPHFEIWCEAVKEFGIQDFSRKEYECLASGFSRRDSARNIFEHFGIMNADGLVEKLYRRKGELSDRCILADEVELYRSTLELVLEAKHAGIRIAVASSSESAEKVLKRYRMRDCVDCPYDARVYDVFDHVISGKVAPGKPHPKIFFEAASAIGVYPNECVVFEDAVPGVIAAKKAGMYCVALDRTGINKELKDHGADIIVEDLSSLSFGGLCSVWGDKGNAVEAR